MTEDQQERTEGPQERTEGQGERTSDVVSIDLLQKVRVAAVTLSVDSSLLMLGSIDIDIIY